MSNKEVYTAIVLGCGRIGATFEIDSRNIRPSSHAAAIKANPSLELVGLVDLDAAALKRATDFYRVPGFADAKAAIAQINPDVVVISTPPATHEEYLTLACNAGVRVVVCEKPVSDSLESALRMIKIAEASQSTVIVNHQRRFFPLFVQFRERIAAGEFGRVQQVSAYYTNGLANNGTHTVDALQFLLGDTIAWAIGVENRLNKTAPFGTNIDGVVGFSEGAVATLQSLDNTEFGAHDFVLVGTKGAITIRQWGFRFETIVVKEGVTFSGVKELDWDNGAKRVEPQSMLTGIYDHVVACLEGREASRSTLEDGLRTMRVLEALAASAEKGGEKIII